MSKQWAVIGASSMIATQACLQLEQDSSIKLQKGDLNSENPIDITDKNSADSFFERNQFEWALLFSAYTNVNEAEKQRNDKDGICWKINVEGTKNIVDTAKKYGKKLVFISTDFVFDGTAGPYDEEAAPGPNMDKVGWYGITKIEGEKYIQKNLDSQNYIILRISFPYSGIIVGGKEDFATKVLKLHKEGGLYPMYTDQTFTPTFIADVAPALKSLIESNQTGIFNLASPDATTPYDFAKELLNAYEGKDVEIKKGELKPQLEQEGAVPRPLKGGLKVSKITPLFPPTNWKEGAQKTVANFAQS